MKKYTILLLGLICTNLYSQSYTVTEDVNLRDKPNTNSNVLKILKIGDTIVIDSIGNTWSSLNIENEQKGYVKTKYLVKNSEGLYDNSENSTTTDYSLFYCILTLLFCAYIVALIKARNNTIVVIAGWTDLILLAVPLIGFIFILLSGVTKENIDENRQAIILIYGVVSGTSLLISFWLSVSTNKGNTMNMIISILAKLFVVIVMIFLLIFILGGSGSKKDGRYKDGTKGNQSTFWKLILTSIATFTIISLIKNKQEQDLIYQLNNPNI